MTDDNNIAGVDWTTFPAARISPVGCKISEICLLLTISKII